MLKWHLLLKHVNGTSLVGHAIMAPILYTMRDITTRSHIKYQQQVEAMHTRTLEMQADF